jgi:pimeloyl-ACP methyl ester carboxylesterase
MDHRLLQYRQSRVSYYCFGQGSKTAFCFHGYGENATTFNFLEKYAGDQFTFYSIDLPFHGKTEWKQDQPFSSIDLQEIISQIRYPESGTVTLIGFSLGGRMALSLYQSQPEAVERLVLLAPDGLKLNFWYWLATQTWVGGRIFALTMNRPGWFFGFLKLLNRTGLVNASIFKFVNHYIGNKKVRHQLYDRWTGLRKIKPELEEIKFKIRENKTPVRLIYGKHDRIILSSVGEKFQTGIDKYCRISVIHSGHQVLQETHAKDIINALTT